MNNLQENYNLVRKSTEHICNPLNTEDYLVQSISDSSPPKWHLAHTSWFFENFILQKYKKNYKTFNSEYSFLFNSYYNSIGQMLEKSKRSLITRPNINDIYNYRKYIDQSMNELLSETINDEIKFILQTGLNHEQQHQELLLMDIKSNFYYNPLKPAYIKSKDYESKYCKLNFLEFGDEIINIGHENNDFCFDNEKPVHKAYINKFKIASRPVLNGEYLEFIENNGYNNPKFWLSDGWIIKNKNSWSCPLYWEKIDNEWYIFSLNGLEKIALNSPVSHVSYYEADAYSHWALKRLINEFEWEYISKKQNIQGNFMDSNYLKPISYTTENQILQMFGDTWEWTSSAYLPYPGFNSLYEGLGEYNGKFMINQMVLRGGSCVTPKSHIRSTYRNFFYPESRWQFSGIRLANNE
jgi:ergothioneine biosynthesis protein EgtB